MTDETPKAARAETTVGELDVPPRRRPPGQQVSTLISERVRNQVRSAFLAGQYPGVPQLAKAFNIPSKTIHQWRSSEGWDELKAQIDTEAKRRLVNKLAEKKSEIDDQHFKLWGAFDAQVFMYMKKAQDDKRLIGPKTLDTLSKVLERSQKGRRIACGADASIEVREDRHIVIEYQGLDEIIGTAQAAMSDPNEGRKADMPHQRCKDADFITVHQASQLNHKEPTKEEDFKEVELAEIKSPFGKEQKDLGGG